MPTRRFSWRWIDWRTVVFFPPEVWGFCDRRFFLGKKKGFGKRKGRTFPKPNLLRFFWSFLLGIGLSLEESCRNASWFLLLVLCWELKPKGLWQEKPKPVVPGLFLWVKLSGAFFSSPQLTGGRSV